MMGEYYSMADFVLNHVDTDHPKFQSYLNGNEKNSKCFYILSEEQYQKQLKKSDFDNIFRPRPFPLFSIFRRKPKKEKYSKLNYEQRLIEINKNLKQKLPNPVIGILSIFNLIKNDQMLLDEQYEHIIRFRKYLKKEKINSENIFELSKTQETQHKPYIFRSKIDSKSDLLKAIRINPKLASEYERYDNIILGEEIRALTTFSHVQIDLNTSTYEGLKLLIDDFAWYLNMDLNMLRLDAANFAFKKWGTSCFGLPEVSKILKILYLSMDCVSPRNVANLEVNDLFGNILTQMSNKLSHPPMMYDFHLVSLLPIVFNTGDPKIILRIPELIEKYDIPKESIRFSVIESHDGKSVRGSMDLLKLKERQGLADQVEKNKGKIKYKSVQKFQYDATEFEEVCMESNIDFNSAKKALFKEKNAGDVLFFKENIRNETDISQALGLNKKTLSENNALKFFINKVLHGHEPYELCIATIDSMIKLKNKEKELNRYLAFYTLAFALMGRNVKSIYFNDLLGLPNDYERLKKSGELRDLKRTKSDFEELKKSIENPNSITYKIAKGMNNLIALVDSDPAMHFRGKEAEAFNYSSGSLASVIIVHNSYDSNPNLVIINVGNKTKTLTINIEDYGIKNQKSLFDNILNKEIPVTKGILKLEIEPFGRVWLTRKKVLAKKTKVL